MGCSQGDEYCDYVEHPEHQVTIAKGVWMGQTEVTQEAFQKVTGQDPSGFKGAKRPVESVTWDEARNYCQAVDSRLPTEAEWEYAARAGGTASTYGEIDQIAWFEANGLGKTHKVGVKQANAWGLYDMLGNVSEWVADWSPAIGVYDAGYATDPLGPENGKFRSVRGGAWYDSWTEVRASSRSARMPADRYNFVGFRCVAGTPGVGWHPPAVPQGGLVSKVAFPKSGRPGDTMMNPTDELTYVWITPGTFQMGCSPGDKSCVDEEPPRRVTISQGFWMGQTEVTQAAYRKVTEEDPSVFKGARRPVEHVTWDEANYYCQSVEMRLPTEAEWEYAARAGSTGITYGDLDRTAWHKSNSGGTTHEAAGKQANAWGLYDMLGNVSEWVADWYQSGYPSGDATDPQGPDSGDEGRVFRGGAWDDEAARVRASHRERTFHDNLTNDIGFRCAVNGKANTEAVKPGR
jgi:formylglycine-generating enzyme required for sulfatase activity